MDQNKKHHPVKKPTEPNFMKPILWMGCTIILLFYLGQLPQRSVTSPEDTQAGTTEVDTIYSFADRILEEYRNQQADTQEGLSKNHSWTSQEVDSFLKGCEGTSNRSGLNHVGVTNYCDCTLNGTVNHFPETPPNVAQWTDERLLEITAMCSAKVLDDPLVEYSPVNEHSLSSLVDLLIEFDYYQPALNMLRGIERTAVAERLLEKTHLNYGLYSMNTFDPEEMRSRMSFALVQFTEVLRINSINTVAREQIEQIMGVYSTLPERGPDREVLEGLNEVGFNY